MGLKEKFIEEYQDLSKEEQDLVFAHRLK